MMLGREHREVGRIETARVGPRWALGISKGLASPAPKLDPNEDACGVVVDAAQQVAVVADAHFGALAAEEAVLSVLVMALEPPARVDWMGLALERAGRRILQQRTRSASAVLAVRCVGTQVRWCSVGDCRLYRVSPAQTTVLNTRNHSYLGDGPGVPLSCGEAQLYAGERVVLASDGIPECTYGIESFFPSDVGRIAARGAPEEAVTALMMEALRRGGEDNIAVAIGEIAAE